MKTGEDPGATWQSRATGKVGPEMAHDGIGTRTGREARRPAAPVREKREIVAMRAPEIAVASKARHFARRHAAQEPGPILRPGQEHRPSHHLGLDLVQPEELRSHVETVGEPRRARHLEGIALARVARLDIRRNRLLIIERCEGQPPALDRCDPCAVPDGNDMRDVLARIAREGLDQPCLDPRDIETPEPADLDGGVRTRLTVEQLACGRPQADLAQRLADIDDDHARHACPNLM